VAGSKAKGLTGRTLVQHSDFHGELTYATTT
jgi:hypothetical protein